MFLKPPGPTSCSDELRFPMTPTNGVGGYVNAATRSEARQIAGAVQGRNSTVALRPVLDVPEGEWALTLQTSFVDPAYAEPDVSWCEPGGEPSSPAANAGAFGAKRASVIRRDAHELATSTGQPVKVVWSREAVVRNGKKRPPVSLGRRLDGSGEMPVLRSVPRIEEPFSRNSWRLAPPSLAVPVSPLP